MLKSPKAKGSRAEREVAKMLVDSGLDRFAMRQPLSGAIAGLKSDIHTSLPFLFEVKNTENWSPLKYYRQAKMENNLGGRKTPVVVMTRNREGYYAFLDFQDFINLIYYAMKSGYPDST